MIGRISPYVCAGVGCRVAGDALAPLSHLTAIADLRLADSGGIKPDNRLGLEGLGGIEPPPSGGLVQTHCHWRYKPMGHLGSPQRQQTVWLLTAVIQQSPLFLYNSLQTRSPQLSERSFYRPSSSWGLRARTAIDLAGGCDTNFKLRCGYRPEATPYLSRLGRPSRTA